MSLWSKIGKIASIVGPIAAIPFTGGASAGLLAKGGLLASIGNIAGKVAPVLSSMAGAQATGKRADTQQDLSRDALALRRYELEQKAPGQRMDNAIRASKISRAAPVKMNWAGPGSGMRPGGGYSITGGYANDVISPDARRLADDVTYQMLMEQLGRKGAPDATPTRGSSVGDKILGGAAAGSSIIGAVMGQNKSKAGAGNPEVGGQMPGYERMTQILDPTDIDDTEDY